MKIFVPATSDANSNQFEFLRFLAEKKFVADDREDDCECVKMHS